MYWPKIQHVKNFNTDSVLMWRLILDEYSPNIEYIPGRKIFSPTIMNQGKNIVSATKTI